MSLVDEVGDAVLRRAGRVAGRLREVADRPVDVLESDDEYLVAVDAPGATTSDVSVNYRDGFVEVGVDRFREYREGFGMRFPGRALAVDVRAELPGDAVVDPRAARATLRDDGTLHVFLPKRAALDVDIEADDADEETVDAGA